MKIIEYKLKALEFSKKEFNEYIKSKIKICKIDEIDRYEKCYNLKVEILRSILHDFKLENADLIIIKDKADIILKSEIEIIKKVEYEIDKIFYEKIIKEKNK